MRRRITVSNLTGTVDKVIERICSLANLYCAYEDGVLVVRDTQTFTVALPPIEDSDVGGGSGGSSGGDSGSGDSGSGGSSSSGGDSGGGSSSGSSDVIGNISSGLAAITKLDVSSDPTTRTLIYTATQRTAKAAEQYFERLRASTALIVYETYIWEVQLTNANATGIRWQQLGSFGELNLGFNASGALSTAVTGTPISIGLPTKGDVNFSTGDVFQFLSQQGAVKTISQPQLTVLSGSRARLRAAETRNYISELTRTVTEQGQESVSTSTDQVDSGFTLDIQSNWDQATVYANISIALEEFIQFEEFEAGTNGTLRLPRTSNRQVDTSVRVRPGDAILIAGLVREQDAYNKSGPGFNNPILPTSRSTETRNTELVFLLRPRVIIYKSPNADDVKKAAQSLPADLSTFVYDPSTAPQTDLPLGTATSDMLDPAPGPAVKKEAIKPPEKPADKDWRK